MNPSPTALSVNLNKVALVRNTRHLGIPSVERAATLCLRAGAHGITVHPRPDERHIRPDDVRDLHRLLQAWPAVKRSGLLRHPVVRVDAQLLRGRVMLAAAAAGVGGGNEVRAATRSARRLARESRVDAGGHADLLWAGIAAVRGRPAQAVESLVRARRRFETEGLRLAAAYASRRWGETAGGAEGHRAVREADDLLTSRTIQDPIRWLAVHAPGFTRR